METRKLLFTVTAGLVTIATLLAFLGPWAPWSASALAGVTWAFLAAAAASASLLLVKEAASAGDAINTDQL